MYWIIIAFLAVFAVCWFSVVKYDVQMYQQNSYRPERYWTWLRNRNIMGHNRWIFIPAALLVWWQVLVPLAMAAMVFHAVWEFRIRYKVRLVYTARVKRLIAVHAMLTAAVLVPVALLCGDSVFFLAALMTLVCSKALLLLADFLLRPVEKLINLRYINEAKAMIAAHRDLIIIGVTGSFGKTSTKNVLYRVLSEKYNVLMTPGNFNTTLGVVRTIREHLKPYHQVFIVEMGAKQSGDIKEICDLVHPHIGIVTSVGNMHLETFGSLRGVQDTKFELIGALPSDGLGVINMDSEGIASYPDIPRHCSISSCSLHRADAACRAENVTYSRRGVSFDVAFAGREKYTVETRLMGDGNILNILAALVVADRLGVPVRQQKSAVASLQPVEHRLSMSSRGNVTVLDDAYNSNPVGAAMALAVLRRVADDTDGRAVVVTPGFVEMGTAQEEANYELGKNIARYADKAVIVNRYNRQAIMKGLEDSGFDKDSAFYVDSLDEAVRLIGTIVSPGDVVLYENDLPDTFK